MVITDTTGSRVDVNTAPGHTQVACADCGTVKGIAGMYTAGIGPLRLVCRACFNAQYTR